MVWVVEKKVFRYILNTGFESLEIPVRVKFEFEVVEGAFVPDTLTKEILYNQGIIERRCSQVKLASLNNAIEEMVESEVMEYLRRSGYTD
jgi:hypothetical protein